MRAHCPGPRGALEADSERETELLQQVAGPACWRGQLDSSTNFRWWGPSTAPISQAPSRQRVNSRHTADALSFTRDSLFHPISSLPCRPSKQSALSLNDTSTSMPSIGSPGRSSATLGPPPHPPGPACPLYQTIPRYQYDRLPSLFPSPCHQLVASDHPTVCVPRRSPPLPPFGPCSALGSRQPVDVVLVRRPASVTVTTVGICKRSSHWKHPKQGK